MCASIQHAWYLYKKGFKKTELVWKQVNSTSSFLFFPPRHTWRTSLKGSIGRITIEESLYRFVSMTTSENAVQCILTISHIVSDW